MPDVKIIGHRGAMAHELENSMKSFETSLEMGASILEMDVHVSRDFEVIVIHDEKINRIANGKGSVSKMNLEQLKSYKLRDGQEIPTLREVLEQFNGKCQFFIEIKAKNAIISSYEIVKELDMLDVVTFSCFHGPWLLALKSRDKRVRIAFISGDKKQKNIQIATSLKAEAIHLEQRIATQELIDEAKSKNLEVYVWVIDKPKIMKKFIDMGVDGIITNKPDTLDKMLKEY